MVQSSLFQLFAERGEQDLAAEILGTDINELTPIQAWQLLERVKKGLV